MFEEGRKAELNYINSTDMHKKLGYINGKVPVLNQVPRHEDVPIASLSTAPLRRMGEWKYGSTHS
jgi:hypothetical protein